MPLVRKNYGKIRDVLSVPNLIHIQLNSFKEFLQLDVPPEKREKKGLQRVLEEVFPIEDFYGSAELRFKWYELDKPKYTPEECVRKGITYAAPLKLRLELRVFETDEKTGTKRLKSSMEQDVYFGEIPMMTEVGSFIINGVERVVVNQLHRSPGVYFSEEPVKIGRRPNFSARIIPDRGSWIDFEFDSKDILYARIDKRRKVPITTLLKALGYTPEEIVAEFYDRVHVKIKEGKLFAVVEESGETLHGLRSMEDIKLEDGSVVLKEGKRITKKMSEKLVSKGVKSVRVDKEDLLGKYLAHDLVDMSTGEVVAECGDVLTEEIFNEIEKRGIDEFLVVQFERLGQLPTILETMKLDKAEDQLEAIIDVYRRLRPGDHPTPEMATNFFKNLFFNPERYNLTSVGRMKINRKLGLNIPLSEVTLTKYDILYTAKYLIALKEGREGYFTDDIDHLGNRRVKTVGELLENQFRIGLLRLERMVKERMTMYQDLEKATPVDIVSSKPAMAALKEFFGGGQLSQFIDQTNPLSEITHKRRLTAMGPGGLSRERAGFEVRDVHPSHYGRICPIETPEGPNIGLITSLSVYARVNEFGFLETPYRVVKKVKENGKLVPVVTDEIKYLFALEEEDKVIAQANAPLDDKGRFLKDVVAARVKGEFSQVSVEEVDLMDVSPKQVVSVSASLIPFLEHDDANRALMGANMQRQAVPLIRTEPPLVGTGMEKFVARDSGKVLFAREDGVVKYVDGTKVIVERKGSPGIVDVYRLTKFYRTNQNTCFNQVPRVKVGDEVKKGDVIADGPAISNGELALGKNVLVAFMPWGGYNFEDSILISERLLRDDVYTSIHIEEFEVSARDTKLGKEEITRDIPGVSEALLKNLDENGIVKIGTYVRPGDILVGKITPKAETQLSPEEKLLMAIFGEKASEVKDTSLRVPHGIEGTVIGIEVFSRSEKLKQKMVREEKKALEKEMEEELSILRESFRSRLSSLLLGKEVASSLTVNKKTVIKKGEKITQEVLDAIPFKSLGKLSLRDKKTEALLKSLVENYHKEAGLIEEYYKDKMSKLMKGDDLPPGVLTMVRVYVAMKRRLSVGDKMSGRHGNKGIVAKVLPIEDMPYLEDGTPVDMVLNPLGVPSRMNIGQVLETHLGWAVKELGKKVAELVDKGSKKALRKLLERFYGSDTSKRFISRMSDDELVEFARKLKDGIPVAVPVFDGASEDEIKEALELAGLPKDGKTVLFDGRTGEPFKENVTIGYMYMLKLHHLVDDKVHARSTGPYSLITQQPLGGKSQFGGQRLGEMEVWALEAYGASYTLQEFLTVKSDDMEGRLKTFDSIVRGDFKMEPTVPESFKVLIKELNGLCIDVELITSKDKEGNDRKELIK